MNSERRAYLLQNAPDCPECDTANVRLMDDSDPAEWKCGNGHNFPHEPEKDDD